MYDMLIGAEVIAVHPCGVKPAMLLYKSGLWLVYRTGVRCFTSEQAARKCMRCMLERRGRRPLGCMQDGQREGAKPQTCSCGCEGKVQK